MMDIYSEIQELVKRNETAAVATLISISGSTPRGQGAKMLIRRDGSISGSVGGGILEGRVCEAAKAVILERQPRILDFDLTEKGEDGMVCGGKAQVYIEPIVPMSTLYIFGGGHISYHLARLGKMTGFRVVVIDDRKKYANAGRFPDVDETIADDYPRVFPQLVMDDLSYVVIVTRGHAHDLTILEWAVETDARYIGMIGSRNKIRNNFDNLMEKGVSEEKLGRVHAPIGLAIHAETPEEIAVSIMAEIIQVRNSDNPSEKRSICAA